MDVTKIQDGIRGRRSWRSLCAGLALATASTACVDQAITLAVADGSAATLQASGAQGDTTLTGSITTRVQVPVDVAAALGGMPLVGTIDAQDLLIAGSSISLGGGVETGTICISLDTTKPNTGAVTVNVTGGMLMIDSMINARIRLTNPAVADMVGPIDLATPVQATVPVALGDLLGVLNGTPLPISFNQMLMASLPASVPVVGGGSLSGQLVLQSLRANAAAPAGPLLAECRALVGAPAPAAN